MVDNVGFSAFLFIFGIPWEEAVGTEQCQA